MSLKTAFREIEEAMLAEVQRHYGERLVSLVIYGSAGRGTMRPDSDIDALIVAKELPPGRIPRVNDFAMVENRLAPLLERFGLEGISTELSPVFKTPEPGPTSCGSLRRSSNSRSRGCSGSSAWSLQNGTMTGSSS